LFLFISVSLTLHGNFDEVIGLNKGKAIQELQITLQAKFGTPPGVLTVMDVKNGKIFVVFEPLKYITLAILTNKNGNTPLLTVMLDTMGYPKIRGLSLLRKIYLRY
jgi:hypothetical protein